MTLKVRCTTRTQTPAGGDFGCLVSMYLCVKGAPGVADVVGATEDKTREDFFLLDALQPQLQILPGTCIVRLHVVTQQAQYLHCVLQNTHTHINISNKHIIAVLKHMATWLHGYMAGVRTETISFWLQDLLSI